MKRILILSFFICCSAMLMAAPAYMWYGTYSVENYVGNGCSGMNLGTCHEDADGFSAAVQAAGVNNPYYRYNRRDAACTAATMKTATAEINYLDFMFYAGHGDGSGPFLGCSATYTLDCWTDMVLGQNGYLKWIQGAACQWFADSYAGMTKFQRWSPAFKGIHVVMGHKAVTYDHAYSNQMSTEFWNRWKVNGYGISTAWIDAQIYWIYTIAGNTGLCPGGMGANSSYYQETYAAATDAKAPEGCTIFTYRAVGSPQY